MLERAKLPNGVAVVIAEPGSENKVFRPRPDLELPDEFAFRTTIDGRFRYMTTDDLERATQDLLHRAELILRGGDPSLPHAGALADELTANGYWPSATHALKRMLKRMRGQADEPPPWETHERIEGPA
ncbi:MAG TPA: hypothetical protein VFE65_14480 [Pseudonocardia sp.]|jgi:hypothetical protein|nr:hypothetical protein [Pseudonocardia sp.]